jgi:hypothetical protein
LPQHHWRRVGQIWNFFNKPEHGGLSSDGQYFFLAEQDDEAYAAIDVVTGKAVWQVQRGDDYPPLPEWIHNGHIQIIHGPAAGRYRIIGREQHYPLMVDEVLGTALRIHARSDELALVDVETQHEFEWLPYELPTDWSNKWAVASFSDDGSTIAVLVDHAVTFFRHDGPAHAESRTLMNQFVPRSLPGSLWHKVGSITGAYEYPQHAGISTDGRHFMLVEYTGEDYFVIDIHTQETVWRSGWIFGQHSVPPLGQWIKDGFVEIEQGPAAGRYRIFGLEQGEPLLVDKTTGISLDIDDENSRLILRNMTTLQELQRLPYLPSDDWTFASFAEDGSVIAVFANHAVTFFAPASHKPNK